jgi:hypothetical protein
MSEQKQEYKLILSTVDKASSTLLALRSQIENMASPLAKVNAEFDKTSAKLSELRSKTMGLQDALNQGMPWINTRLALPTLALGGLAIKQSADFEEATNRMKVLAGYAENYNATAQKAVADTQALSREIAKGLPFGPTEVMDSFGVILGMDPNMDKAKSQIRPVLNLALSDNVAPAFAASLMQTFQAAFNGVTDVQASNLMAKLVASSSVRLTDLKDSLRNMAGSTVTKKNATPEDMLAATGVLSRSALVGPEAGTKMAVFLRELSMSAIDENKQKALARMGIRRRDVFDKEGNLRDLESLLNLFYKNRNNPLLANVVEKDNLVAVQFLLSRLDDFKALKKELIDQKSKTLETGSAFLQAKAQTEGFKGSVRALRGSLEELTLKMGDAGLLKAATGLVTSLTQLVELLGKADPIVLQLGMGLGALTLALAALGNTLNGLYALQAFLPGALGAIRGEMLGVAAAANAAGAATAGMTAAGAGAAGGKLLGLGAGPIALGVGGVIATTIGAKMWADSEAEKLGKSWAPSRPQRISDIIEQKKRQEALQKQRSEDFALKQLMAPKIAKQEADERALRNLERQLTAEQQAAATEAAQKAQQGPTAANQPLGKITIDINGLPQGSKVDTQPTEKVKFDLNLGTIMR